MMKYIEAFRVNYKTEMCRNWQSTGQCEFEDECAYAHGLHELNQKTTLSQPHKNYKTKMCKKWHSYTPGYCSYGEKCQFIHDEYEVKPNMMESEENGQDNEPEHEHDHDHDNKNVEDQL